MKAIVYSLFALLIGSCGVFSSLNSGTSIGPSDSFVLGNNRHGSFKAQLKNSGRYALVVYQAPVGGGRQPGQTLAAGGRLVLKVPANTALVIANNSTDTGFVELKVAGDLGLSMN